MSDAWVMITTRSLLPRLDPHSTHVENNSMTINEQSVYSSDAYSQLGTFHCLCF